MITEQDLQAAIAECEGTRNPNANTCLKLAAFYTIKDKLYPEEQNHFADADKMMYSTSAPNRPVWADTGTSYAEGYKYSSDTEFGRIVSKKGIQEIMPIIDELMDTISVLNPRLYAGVMRKLNEN